MRNDKGFTLIEAMVAVVILGIVIQAFIMLMSWQLKTTAKVKKTLAANVATAPGADQRTYLPVLNRCAKLKGTPSWYVKRTSSTVVSFYTNTACNVGGVGTLTAQTNPTFDDDSTNTFWNVSGSGATLRVLVRQLNLPIN